MVIDLDAEISKVAGAVRWWVSEKQQGVHPVHCPAVITGGQNRGFSLDINGF